MVKNDYYSSTLNQLFDGKDSIIEMAQIVSYNNERQVARVWTMTSNQFKDDVPVYFSSLFSNTGIISPPVEGSTSMLLWGPDRQPFLLPVQITLPSVQVNKGLTHMNASPGLKDVLHTLKNVQGGEHLIRSLGGAYIFLKNLGDAELGTSRLHRLAVTEKDGALDLVVERIKMDTGNSRFYLGPTSMDSNEDLRTHYYFELEEYADEPSKLVNVDNEELVNQVLSGSVENIEMQDKDKIYKSQKGHVYTPEGYIQVDPVDQTELFSKEEFEKDSIKYQEKLSKGGRKVITASSPDSETEVIMSPDTVEVNQRRTADGVMKKTSIRIDEYGYLWCGRDGKEYDLIRMLEWFYEQRTQ